jgi:hypothetical protein
MTASRIAASSTVRAIGPTWSRVRASGITPAAETRPKVGFRPTHPQKLAGTRMLPPVSEPIVAAARWAAVAAAAPPDEPPGIRVVS